jgi:uncharacterized membrane protein (UPF0127 family)
MLAAMFLAASVVSPPAVCEPAPVTTLSVDDHAIQAEVADTPPTRMRGLAHRSALAADGGMLFVFTEPALYAMWMRDTHIPLSVAFLDEKGVIINIAEMQADTLAKHFAARPAKYALEVNRGWFRAHGVLPGMSVIGIENLP